MKWCCSQESQEEGEWVGCLPEIKKFSLLRHDTHLVNHIFLSFQIKKSTMKKKTVFFLTRSGLMLVTFSLLFVVFDELNSQEDVLTLGISVGGGVSKMLT